jgi:molybdopterin biosynthesis enzyme
LQKIFLGIESSQDVPGFARAFIDGFAVQSDDTLEAREDRPVCLHLVGSVPMGALPHVRVARGEAAEVSTGCMMPPGAQEVVMIERDCLWYSKHARDTIEETTKYLADAYHG